MTVSLVFEDYTVISGKTATDALRRLGKVQWEPLDIEPMKRRMSDRAWSFFGKAIDPLLPDDEFVTALDAAGICAVIYGGTPAKPSPPWKTAEREEDE